MRETLYLRLGSTPDAEVEFGVASTDLRALRTTRGRLPDAAALAEGRRVVAFFPASEVQLTSVELPGRINARLLQAVPYALEDQLAEDVDTLHFAVGDRLDELRIPVAVVSRSVLDSWQKALAAQGLRPETLVPETLALPPPEESAATVLATDQDMIVRLPGHGGFACDAEDLDTYLSLEAIDPAAPVSVYVTSGHQRDWSQRGPSTRLMPAPSALHVLANGLRPGAINLLQGGYSEREGLQKYFKPWRLAASLALAWMLVAALGMGVQAARLGAEVAELDQRNITRYQQLFPSEQRIADLETQLEQKIRSLAGDGKGGPLPLLESVAKALVATPQLKLTGLQYREGSLYLSLSADNLQALEALRAWYGQQDDAQLEVQSANAESDGAKIRARVGPV